MLKPRSWLAPRPDLGLLLLRLGGAYLLLMVHGLPKLQHYAGELAHIDDPLHLGRGLTLWLALLAEVLCPLAIAAGLCTRLACLPVLVLLLVSMLAVHPDWSLADGQFGWLLLVIFASISVAGPGRYTLLALLGPADTKRESSAAGGAHG
ncbi:DoxX family protein [Duganella qianjiadongensis]|uniref:DoxX family membrane protein n=1 Tax=Duganella qianjiadongensis TaxID=2692176 RepID=A0ABW9VIT0_9BURK|nr:DoxX family protein [Duganella qianjiadongensis]MYM38790.1 DoxX family membrane protein [Duganella qianjiadongensis]